MWRFAKTEPLAARQIKMKAISAVSKGGKSDRGEPGRVEKRLRISIFFGNFPGEMSCTI